jgi:hypothetical protein
MNSLKRKFLVHNRKPCGQLKTIKNARVSKLKAIGHYRSSKRQQLVKVINVSSLQLPKGFKNSKSSAVKLCRAKAPVGKPWPIRDLNAQDAPQEVAEELLKDVLKERGWKHSVDPCHSTWDQEKDIVTLWIKEFEAAVRGETPRQAFGKDIVQEGYQLKRRQLPNHMLWFMGRFPYRVPGVGTSKSYCRDDFVNVVVNHGAYLPGDAGNYRISKFPGTEAANYKTNLTEAFNGKSWYPTTYILPKDKDSFLRHIGSSSQSTYWIGKPSNDYGGKGICVWKDSDPDLAKMVKESGGRGRQVIQRYLADPLLIGGYKFHMRIHLLITNLDPLQAFVQENGQCLFATKPYTMSSKTFGATFDPPVHVTNMTLNATAKNKDNYFRTKPVVGRGQQIRMRRLEAYLEKNYPSFDKRRLWQQILTIAKDYASYVTTVPGVKRHGKLVPDRHFEMFGMDLMMDKNFKVWMCEVNTDPGLSYPEEKVLGEPNPDYNKEFKACSETLHDLLTILGLDASHPKAQGKGSLRHWFDISADA